MTLSHIIKFTKHKASYLATSLLLISVVAYIALDETSVRNKAEHDIKLHADIISALLWSLDTSAINTYLSLAVRDSDYETLEVFTDNNETFLSITGKPLSATSDIFFKRIQLLPTITLSTDVLYQNKVIGKIKAEVRIKTIYSHLYATILGLLSLLAALLYIRTLNINQILDSRVQERTAELLNSQEQLQSLMDISPIAIAYANFDGDLHYCNKKFTDLFGYSLADIPTIEHWYKLAYPNEDYRKKVVSEWEQKCKAGTEDNTEIESMEVTVTCKDGTTRYTTLTTAILGNQVIGAFGDLTERINLEQQLRQAQKMESIGTLAGGIAHDFNNILNSTQGFAQLAQMQINSPEKLHESLEEVLAGSVRAGELVNQILTFSRKAERELQPLMLQAITTEALKLMRSTIPSTIEFKQDINLECGSVLADATEIHQVVMNLCTNAYHAMKNTGGILSVSLQPFNIEDDTPIDAGLTLSHGSYVKLEISDTGTGIDERVINRIFEPYYTTKEKGSGTGLGLAVVHGIITSMKGKVSVRTEKNKGTVFTIYFPTENSAAESNDHKNSTEMPTGSERILVVDDNPSITLLNDLALTELGYKVETFTSSLEALERFKSSVGDFDLILTDMTMPDMTGAELAKEVFRAKPDIPIILCSGHSDLINEEKAMQLGLKAYLTKPITITNLAETIRNVLDASNN